MKRKYLLLFLPLLFFLFFFPEESLLASCEGVRLWFHTVLPALLPFLILSNILVRSGLILPLLSHLDPVWNRLLGLTSGGAYCLALGVLCGFPWAPDCRLNFCDRVRSPGKRQSIFCVSPITPAPCF